MFELLLVTLVSASSANTAIESQVIETFETSYECTDAVSRFSERKMQLTNGMTLTIKLVCERK